MSVGTIQDTIEKGQIAVAYDLAIDSLSTWYSQKYEDLLCDLLTALNKEITHYQYAQYKIAHSCSFLQRICGEQSRVLRLAMEIVTNNRTALPVLLATIDTTADIPELQNIRNYLQALDELITSSNLHVSFEEKAPATCEKGEVRHSWVLFDAPRPGHYPEKQNPIMQGKTTLLITKGTIVGSLKHVGDPSLLGLRNVQRPDGTMPIIVGGIYGVPLEIVQQSHRDFSGPWSKVIISQKKSMNVRPIRQGWATESAESAREFYECLIKKRIDLENTFKS